MKDQIIWIGLNAQSFVAAAPEDIRFLLAELDRKNEEIDHWRALSEQDIREAK